MPLPRSALLVLWLDACRRGLVGPDDLADAVRGDDPQHLVVGWPDREAPFGLSMLPAAAQSLDRPSLRLALPVPGDLLGLAGPPALNAQALEAGEAVILAGRAGTLALVPVEDARTILWEAAPALPPALLDPAEAGRTLRQVLLVSTNELARLDVASWQPEIPDLLLNLRDRAGLPVPPGIDPRTTETLERAVLCLDIVDLAREDGGGAVSAHEIGARTRCLTDLEVAARRAVVACCSDSLGAS